MNDRQRQFTVLAGALLLAFSDSAAAPQVTRVGDVTLTISSMTLPGVGRRDTVMGVAAFRKGAGGSGVIQSRDFCTVTTLDEAGPPGTLPGEAASAAPPASLNAGDPLTVRQGTQVYTTLKRRQQGTVISYMTAIPSTLKAPTAALSLDIPGAAGGFPAMKNKAFPVVSPVALSTPTPEDEVTLDTTFAWSNPTKQPSTLVMLSGMQEDPEVVFNCLAVDDGKFTFPAATIGQLRKQGFTAGMLTSVGRLSSRTHQEGDAQLNIRVMSMQMQVGF